MELGQIIFPALIFLFVSIPTVVFIFFIVNKLGKRLKTGTLRRKMWYIFLIALEIFVILFLIFSADCSIHFLDAIFGPHTVEGWGYGFGIYTLFFGLPILAVMGLVFLILLILKK